MSERLYLFLVGVSILFALYFETEIVIYGLVVLLIFEAVTDIRITTLTQRIRHVSLDSGLFAFQSRKRFDIEAIRAWRMFVSLVLVLSYFLVYELDMEVIWFVPWFMGFAIMGAGASGVCPVMLGLKWIGFR